MYLEIMFLLICIVVFLIQLACSSCCALRNRPDKNATQQEDIYNISGRVPQQQQQQGQGQWPPHSTTGQVTLDNLTISNETNKHNDDPPTYEEAMRLAIAASQDPSNNVVPAVVPPSAVPMAPPKPSD